MNWFQVLAIAVLGSLFLLSLVAIAQGRATRREGIVWALVWFCVAAAILRPEMTVWIAGVLGIGRGADLVMYCSVVAMLVGFMTVYVRIRRLQRDLTLIVRHLAMREAVSETAAAEANPGRLGQRG